MSKLLSEIEILKGDISSLKLALDEKQAKLSELQALFEQEIENQEDSTKASPSVSSTATNTVIQTPMGATGNVNNLSSPPVKIKLETKDHQKRLMIFLSNRYVLE